MLAYSKGSLNFRDSSVPIPNHLSSVSAPLFRLNADGDSSSDEDIEEIEDYSEYIRDVGNMTAIDNASIDNIDNNISSSSGNNNGPPEQDLTHHLEVTPADHNTIVQVKKQISMPWANLFEFECFNAVQSACFNIAACSDENLVISAPTGCGKTVLFELGILRLLSSRRNPDAKAVFLAPIKALCQEKVRDWGLRFSSLGIRVVELTGDATNKDVAEISKAHIICTTPEKWDSITRRWSEHIYLLGKVQLLLVDEAHNISVGDTRGATLEAVVCRMKTVSRSAPVLKHQLPAINLRIIAVSATLPNIADIGCFIQAKTENVMAFDASFRPVPLTVHVLSYPAQNSEFWFEKGLEKKVPDVLARYSGGRPALIFCNSRKSTEETAELIGKATSVWARDASVVAAAQRVPAGNLKAALLKGVAFHHGNLLPHERSLVESLFRERKLSALCCTSTLAMGVNLPAHLVVIKSTAQWQGKASGYTQMASSALNQMMGRAGRPGLDDSGVAVIMTDDAHRQTYQNLAHGSEVVESNLHEDLVGILNAEVCNKVVGSVDDADEWIKGTFLFTRLKRNPQRYGLHPPAGRQVGGQPLDDATVTAFLSEKIRVAFEELTESGIVEFDEDRIVVSPLKPSGIMSRQMLQLDTMKQILAMPLDANIEAVLKLLSATKEVLQEVRRGQNKFLKDMMPSVRFSAGPKSKKLESVDKTYLLLQGVLGRLPMEDVTMSREQAAMTECAGRVLNALVDHATDTGAGRGLLSAHMLRRNLAQGLWESGTSEIYQLESAVPNGGVNAQLVDKLSEAGVSSLSDLSQASPFLVEKLAARKAPFGTKLVQAARKVLDQALAISVRIDEDDANKIIVSVTRKSDPAGSSSSSSSSSSSEWDFLNRPASGGGGGGGSGGSGGGQGSSSSSSSSEAVRVEYTLVAFTKQPRVLGGGVGSGKSGSSEASPNKTKHVNGVHLFRKVTEPCVVVLPANTIAAIRASTLCVSLVASVVGLDEHRSLTLPGAAPAEAHNTGGVSPPEKERKQQQGESVDCGDDDDEDSALAASQRARTTKSKSTPGTASSSAPPTSSSSSSSLSSSSTPSSSFTSSSSSRSTKKSMLTQEDLKALMNDDDDDGKKKPPKPPSKPTKKPSKMDSLDKFSYSNSAGSSEKRSSGLTGPSASGGTANGEDVFKQERGEWFDDYGGCAGGGAGNGGGGGTSGKSKKSGGETAEDAWGVEGRRKKSVASAAAGQLADKKSLTSPSAVGYSRKTTTGSRDIQSASMRGAGSVLNTLRRKADETNLLVNVKSSRLVHNLHPLSETAAATNTNPYFGKENRSLDNLPQQQPHQQLRHQQQQQQNNSVGMEPGSLWPAATSNAPSSTRANDASVSSKSVSSFFKKPAAGANPHTQASPFAKHQNQEYQPRLQQQQPNQYQTALLNQTHEAINIKEGQQRMEHPQHQSDSGHDGWLPPPPTIAAPPTSQFFPAKPALDQAIHYQNTQHLPQQQQQQHPRHQDHSRQPLQQHQNYQQHQQQQQQKQQHEAQQAHQQKHQQHQQQQQQQQQGKTYQSQQYQQNSYNQVQPPPQPPIQVSQVPSKPMAMGVLAEQARSKSYHQGQQQKEQLSQQAQKRTPETMLDRGTSKVAHLDPRLLPRGKQANRSMEGAADIAQPPSMPQRVRRPPGDDSSTKIDFDVFFD